MSQRTHEKRIAALERDVKYILERLGQLMIHHPELAKEIGFAVGEEPKKKKVE